MNPPGRSSFGCLPGNPNPESTSSVPPESPIVLVERALTPGRDHSGTTIPQSPPRDDLTGTSTEPPPSIRSPEPVVFGLPKVTVYPLQEWEGYVTSIETKSFEARLLDLTAGDAVENDEATIPINQISERDEARMEVGSVFRWVIGNRRDATGTTQRVSLIVFRYLPSVTESDLRRGREWARRVQRVFED